MSDYRKMVLLEEAEVDRLRQKQLREYDPTVSALARAQAQMEMFLLDEKLSDEEKLMLIEQAQQKFKRLKAAIGPIENVQPVMVAAPMPPVATAAPPGAPLAVAPLAGAPIAAAAPPVAIGPPLAAPSAAGPSGPLDVIERDLDPTLHTDYKALKSLIQYNPKVLRVNSKGELVFKDKLITGTSFSDVAKAVLTGKNITSTPGVSELLKGLQGMHATKKSFTSASVLSALFPSSSSLNVKVKPSLSPSVTSTSRAGPPSPTTFPTVKRVKPDTALPPGRSPRILWLYQPTPK